MGIYRIYIDAHLSMSDPTYLDDFNNFLAIYGRYVRLNHLTHADLWHPGW